ncbi:MAG: DUF6153 family protein [Mycobacteriales bacterium]|nr:DUF6153 family protein [Mycobacteriales bacterium]
MTAPGARAATRALAVLAVLLGLLAMHGLASTHHASAATTATPRDAAQHQAATTAPEQHQHAAVPAVVPEAAAVAAPAGSGCDDDCPDLAVLCLAVLTGAALLAVLLADRRAPLLATPPRHRLVERAPPETVPRPPDPVKELCVSRT